MRILVPSSGPEDWRLLLREPDRQWRDGYSAKELAYAWEGAGGLPPELANLFRTAGSPVFREAVPLLAIPEYKVPLPGGEAASQNDLFLLAAGAGRLVTITVEGKARESFDRRLDDWLQDASAGKRERLAYLKAVLGLSGPIDGRVRYQLLHRAASAVIEAGRFCAGFAVMVVHAFHEQEDSLQDYAEFLRLFGAGYEPGQLVRLGSPGGIELYSGWAQGAIRADRDST
jgi:hypothetical protein